MQIMKLIRRAFSPLRDITTRALLVNLRQLNFLKRLLGLQVGSNRQTALARAKEVYGQLLVSKFHQDLTDQLAVENIFLTQAGVLVFYHFFKEGQVEVWTMLFETAAPRRPLWRQPRLITQFANEQDDWQFISLTQTAARFESFWHSQILGRQLKIYPKYRFTRQIALKHPIPLLTKPHSYNPMISPRERNAWEAFSTFNPAAFYAADRVHILYRAQGFDYVSQVGYATSHDGLLIAERFAEPVYRPTQAFEGASLPAGDPNGSFASGGGSGGIEDPRATVIDDRVYMTYVAYDGWSPPRVALTSIALADFLNHNFLWEQPVLITPPGLVDKSAVIFPEKINGKYVIMHRVFPDILIDYVDSLDFDGQTFLTGQQKISPRSRDFWDSRKIGAGAPPLKTKAGWLLIYQGVDDKDASEYKVGAMLLDLNDPAKVLARSAEPILLPREKYENVGFKAGVVYPCGALIKDDTLFVYYGGADSFVCVATARLDKFINDLQKTGNTNLTSVLMAVEEEGLYE
jgi:beta-1,2-mannobiose phosphorylase / 1,2-beta-oligomannan phosphorylase